jgi:hypothetical protein
VATTVPVTVTTEAKAEELAKDERRRASA